MNPQELRGQMEEEGYTPGGEPTGLGAGIDALVCADSTCSACGHQGREYHPFMKRLGGRSRYTGRDLISYRAFAVCPECGHTEEF